MLWSFHHHHPQQLHQQHHPNNTPLRPPAPGIVRIYWMTVYFSGNNSVLYCHLSWNSHTCCHRLKGHNPMDHFLQVEEILSASYCTAGSFDVKILTFFDRVLWAVPKRYDFVFAVLWEKFWCKRYLKICYLSALQGFCSCEKEELSYSHCTYRCCDWAWWNAQE